MWILLTILVLSCGESNGGYVDFLQLGPAGKGTCREDTSMIDAASSCEHSLILLDSYEGNSYLFRNFPRNDENITKIVNVGSIPEFPHGCYMFYKASAPRELSKPLYFNNNPSKKGKKFDGLPITQLCDIRCQKDECNSNPEGLIDPYEQQKEE